MSQPMLRDGTPNLRGHRVYIRVDRYRFQARVITRIRRGVWLIESRRLPRVFQLHGRCATGRVTVPEEWIDRS